MKKVEDYIRDQKDFVEFISKIPAVIEYVDDIQEREVVSEVLKKAPESSVLSHYLGVTPEESKALKSWIYLNCTPSEIHICYKRLKLNGYLIEK